jgi:hypothetical protein
MQDFSFSNRLHIEFGFGAVGQRKASRLVCAVRISYDIFIIMECSAKGQLRFTSSESDEPCMIYVVPCNESKTFYSTGACSKLSQLVAVL